MSKRKMKDSGVEWLGEIPAEWDVTALSQQVSQVKCKNDNLVEKNLLSLSYGKIKRRDIDTVGGLLPASFEGYNRVESGDIVLRLTDLQNDQHSLRTGLVKENGIVTSAYVSVRPCSRSSSEYLHFALYAFDVAKGFYGMGSGVRQGLTYGDVKQLRLPYPPLDTQRKIAAYLDGRCAKIDEMVSDAKKTIEEYKAWKASVIFEAVTGKNTGSKMKDSGVDWIGKIPVGWNVVPLKRHVSILPGFAFPSDSFAHADGVRLLRGVNVGVGKLHWEESVYWNLPIDRSLELYSLAEGDLIVGLDRPWISDGTRVAFVGKQDVPSLLVQRVCRIRAREGADVRFVARWIASNSFAQALGCETTGVSVPHISTGQIENFRVAMPSVGEQRCIADFLDKKCAAIDRVVAEKESLVADLEAYKKSLIFECVTGKMEVA